MHIPASLVTLVVCLWLLDRTTARPLAVVLTGAAGVAFYQYAPTMALVTGAALALIFLPVGLLLGLDILANAARHLPNWLIFTAPAPKPAALYVLVTRRDLVAVPLLLGLAGLVIAVCR